jgi:hypothetical protein
VYTLCAIDLTKPEPAEKMEGLVWAHTKQPGESHLPFYERPIFWAAGAGVVFAVLQWIFW